MPLMPMIQQQDHMAQCHTFNNDLNATVKQFAT